MGNDQMKSDERSKFIHDALEKVTHEMNLDLSKEQRDLKILEILEAKDNEQNTLFDLIRGQPSPDYALLLGFCYMFGIGVLKDEKEAIKNWKNCKDGHGQYMVGRCYSEGLGEIDVDYEKAFLYFQMSANVGNSCGQNALGTCYGKGEGCDRNIDTAFRLYQKSSAAGNSNSQCNLGLCYEYGKGVKVDLEKALYWYQKASDSGNSDGQCCLASCYEYGKGVEVDLAKAFYWYEKSAAAGNSDGQRKLGTCYEYGKGVETNLEKAVHWYQKSADAGNLSGQWWLANCYEYGKGVEVNLEKAIYFYKISAKRGNSIGQWRLGSKKQVARTVYWYQESTEDECSVRRWWLNDGKEVMEFDRRTHWFRRSTKIGNEYANPELLDLFSQGDICRTCSEKSSSLYKTKDDDEKKVEAIVRSSQVDASTLKQVMKRIGDDGFDSVFKDDLFCGKEIKSLNLEKRTWNQFENAKLVALKYCDDWHIFMNELKVVGNCLNFDTFPFTLRCYSVTYDDVTKRYMLILEFATKGGLRNYLRRSYSRLTWQTKFEALKTIAGFIDTDTPSSDIFADKDVKRSEDELAGHSFNDSTFNHNWHVPYISTKVLGEHQYTPADIDRYSFAMIMWESKLENLDMVEEKRPEIEEGTSNCYAELVEKCWNDDPDKRPTSHELIDIFQNWKCKA